MPLFNLVIQVIDKYGGPDAAKDSKHPKIGDVIDILPAGASLGTAIYRDDHNFWRVLQVDIDKTEAELLKRPEAGDPITNPLLQFRDYRIDLTKLKSETQAQIALNPKAPIPVSLNDIRSAKTKRPPRVDVLSRG